MRAVAPWALAILFVVGSCATFAARPNAKIDNTSLESFRASWQALNAQLNATEQLQLQFAVVRIAMSPYRSVTDVPDNMKSIDPETIRGQIDGMTYKDIMKLADKSSVKVEAVQPCDSHSRASGPCAK